MSDDTLDQENLNKDDEMQEDNPYLQMSDEDFLKAAPPVGGASAVAEPESEASTEGAAGESKADDEGDGDADNDKKKGQDDDPSKAGDADKDGEPAGEDDDKAKGGDDDAPPQIDYEAEYKKLTAPFRANGKEMKVDSVDDAIRLMQLGANYNKKMAAMKPGLKALKLLETNGLLDEEKLSFLIDLDKKKPEAITKLLKDSKIDPLDIDVQKEDEYKPTKYTVSDRELELDSVLEELQNSQHYDRLLKVVTDDWDKASRQIVATTPQLLKVIDAHMANGVYDLISTEVEKRRMLGGLGSVSDLEAYRTVGDELHAAGKFAHLEPKQGSQKPEQKPKVVVAKSSAKADDPALNKLRKAASGTRANSAVDKSTDFNPLAMSDEEFMKQFQPNLL